MGETKLKPPGNYQRMLLSSLDSLRDDLDLAVACGDEFRTQQILQSIRSVCALLDRPPPQKTSNPATRAIPECSNWPSLPENDKIVEELTGFAGLQLLF